MRARTLCSQPSVTMMSNCSQRHRAGVLTALSAVRPVRRPGAPGRPCNKVAWNRATAPLRGSARKAAWDAPSRGVG